MATADDALNVARGELGKGPDKYWAWYPSGQVAWCCIFQSWVLTQVGLPTHYAWVSGLFDAMRAQGRTFAPYQAQPGDLVAFDYDGGGPGAYDHIAMVESVTDQGIVAINGNWNNRVERVLHRWNQPGFAGGIAEIARPYYSTPAPTPGPVPTPSTDEDLMRRFIRPKNSPQVWLIDAGLMWKRAITSEQDLKDCNWALGQSAVPVLPPPAGAEVDTIAGVPVWVVTDSFASSIPTAK